MLLHFCGAKPLASKPFSRMGSSPAHSTNRLQDWESKATFVSRIFRIEFSFFGIQAIT